MRLTVELLQSSLSYLNPLNDRELDLRGHKIPAIENLGVARDLHDSIDFTDNDITVLGNFPLSPRLRCLLLARNRLNTIQSTLHTSLPNLETLILTANRFNELADLDILRHFSRLTHLSLLENPVSRKEHYRYWLLWRCPSLRFLDYQKVKDTEREKATELFGTFTEPSALASSIMGLKSRTFDPGSAISSSNGGGSDENGLDRVSRVKMTDKEKKKVELMIKNAQSLHDIARLEKALNDGKLPQGIDIMAD